MMDKNNLIKRYYESLYENHFLQRYRAFILGDEYYEELLGECIYDFFDFRRNPELFESLPESVRTAYNYYREKIAKPDLGAVVVCKVAYENDVTYAIRVSTDGDDGWLEVYDFYGQEIGVGRTYIELIGWGNRDEIRNQVHRFYFPESLSDRTRKTLWQFGSLVIRKDSPDRFVVIAEKIPEDKQDDVVKIICNATGITEKALRIIFDFLPHSITRNISREKAEDIWKKLTDIKIKTSITEYQSNRFVVIKTNNFTEN